MPLCSFTAGHWMFAATPVENLFIEEYMLRAPGDFVKVYLYALKLCYQPGDGAIGIPSIARAMGMTEEAVEDAFRYWERQGVLQRIKDNPPEYTLFQLAAMMSSRDAPEDALYQYRDFNHALQSLFPSRLLHPEDYAAAISWIEDMCLPMEVVLTMVEGQVRMRGEKIKLKSLEKMAAEWAREGISTVKDANERLLYTTQAYRELKDVLKRLGKRTATPTVDNVELYNTWLSWGFDLQGILAACALTKGVAAPDLRYLNAILDNLRAQGRFTPEAISQPGDDAYKSCAAILRALGVAGSPTDMQMDEYRGWLKGGFTQAGLNDAAGECARRGAGSFDRLSQSVNGLKAKGITDAAGIRAYIAESRELSDIAAQLSDAAGRKLPMSTSGREMIKKWVHAFNTPLDLVKYAAGLAQDARSAYPYMDKLLTTWHEQGIRTVAAAAQAAGGRPVGDTQRVAGSQHYENQRTYKQGELDHLITNPFDEAE